MYEWIKAAHVVSVLVFSGGLIGLFVVYMAIGARGPQETDASGNLRNAIQKWNWFITQPALFLVWAFGIWAAFNAGWFTETWLQIKLIFVIFLSGLHGALSGKLRRMEVDAPLRKSPPSTAIAVLLLASFVAIGVLAVVKPF